MDKARTWLANQVPEETRVTNLQTVSCKLRGAHFVSVVRSAGQSSLEAV